MPVLIEFSRCIGTYSSAKFEYFTYMDKSGGSRAAEYIKGLQENEPCFFSSVIMEAEKEMKENVKEAMRTFALLDEV